jgi:hypothetical protein
MTNLGDAGFWFAQFNAANPISGAAVDNNDRNSLPSWVQPNFNTGDVPNYSFSATTTSKGGQPSWAVMTLPDGEVGLSGAIVDSNSANNSSSIISKINLGPGTPSKFRLYLVTDNTNGDHDMAGASARIRIRGEHPVGNDINPIGIVGNIPAGAQANFNTIPDIYSYLFTDFVPGDLFKLQIHSGTSGEAGSIAGIMFDVVPEPSSAVLLVLGSVACGLARLRRRQG